MTTKDTQHRRTANAGETAAHFFARCTEHARQHPGENVYGSFCDIEIRVFPDSCLYDLLEKHALTAALWHSSHGRAGILQALVGRG